MPRKPDVVFMKPLTPSPQLAVIVGGEPLPRTLATTKVWAYIKKHGLQDKANRRMIHADANLLPVFGGKKLISMFEMVKHLQGHLIDPPEKRARKAKAVECCPTCNRPLERT